MRRVVEGAEQGLPGAIDLIRGLYDAASEASPPVRIHITQFVVAPSKVVFRFSKSGMRSVV